MCYCNETSACCCCGCISVKEDKITKENKIRLCWCINIDDNGCNCCCCCCPSKTPPQEMMER